MGSHHPSGADRPRVFAALAFLVLVAACSGSGAAPSSSASVAGPVELTVFAAASLTDVFTDLGAAFEASHPSVRIVFSFDASSTLRAQIEQGATVDLVASADEENPRRLVAAGLAAGPPTVFARNRLAVIVPATNPGGLADPYGLAQPGVRVIAAGADVPITRYATRLLADLAASSGAGAGFIAANESNVVSREASARSVLTKVELGEGDAAIVYATDAASAGDQVKVLPLRPGVDVLTAYAAVVPQDAPRPDLAAELLTWLSGPAARAIFARSGFLAPK